MSEAANDRGGRRRLRRGANADASGCAGAGSGPGGGRYRRSIIETAILCCLAGSETHGYDLYDRLERVIGDLVYVDSGTMYRMLRAMEQEGMVTSSWQPAEVGPSRRVYVVTDRGFAALQAMADALAARASAMQDLAAKATQIARDSRRSSD